MQNNPFPASIRPECFLPYGNGWSCPTPEEIRTLMQISGLTGSKAATLTGLKDGRTVRRWIGGDTPIPFSAWAILVEYAGFGKIWSV
ncbi:transcriptional regulator [Salmonella enterica]|uniref:transcriptional regulator n=1 Tax=Enterobacteriaceae TaxID=543 RepID=UPI0012870020|nr:transcriptional regulator [Cronobacter muytjensii]EAM5005907.1 transcriptional regulator [Salmonella enterica]EES5376785.1 transcriptional regulator [Escherichia coli]EAT8674914.1 transcriptional regulator [Salmonella enterica]EES5680281.1 transcriptional regulator [Escherichia coli]EFG2528732.1 transcriptional regulator [Escherichia coli]